MRKQVIVEPPSDSAGWRAEVARLISEADGIRANIATEFENKKHAATANDLQAFEGAVLRAQGCERALEMLDVQARRAAEELQKALANETAIAAEELDQARTAAFLTELALEIETQKAFEHAVALLHRVQAGRRQLTADYGVPHFGRLDHEIAAVFKALDPGRELLFATNIATKADNLERIFRRTMKSMGIKNTENDAWLARNVPLPASTLQSVTVAAPEQPQNTRVWPGFGAPPAMTRNGQTVQYASVDG